MIAYCNIANYAFYWYDKRDEKLSVMARPGDMKFARIPTVGNNAVDPRSLIRTGSKTNAQEEPLRRINTGDAVCL